jgi:hypothetical protein
MTSPLTEGQRTRAGELPRDMIEARPQRSRSAGAEGMGNVLTMGYRFTPADGKPGKGYFPKLLVANVMLVCTLANSRFACCKSGSELPRSVRRGERSFARRRSRCA